MLAQKTLAGFIECRSCRAELGWRHADDRVELRAERTIPLADGTFACVRCWGFHYRRQCRRREREQVKRRRILKLRLFQAA